MFHKFLLVPALMSVAGLLMATDSAFAQRGGHGGGHGGDHGGGHGGGHVSAGHSGGHVSGSRGVGHVGAGRSGGRVGAGNGRGSNGGAYGRGSYGGFGRGANGGYGGGGYGRGGDGGYGRDYYGDGFFPGFFGGYFGPWYDTGPSDFPYVDYPDGYDAPAVPYYGAPDQTYAPPNPDAADVASIRVIVPDPQARVWLDGKLTHQSGTERLFNTPALTPGATYSYQVRAAWMQDGREVAQEGTVTVTPGQTTTVVFNR